MMSAFPGVGEAAPPSKADAPAVDDHERLVDMAIEAWRRGDWTEVRDLLEPLLREADEIADPLLREAGLRYLAEATLYDEGLETAEREQLARGYIERLLDHSPSWEPPSGLHGAAFYKLAAKVRSEREANQAAACKDQLMACEADLTELRVDHRSAIERAEELQRDLDADVVQRVDVIQRNRGLAIIPGGVGHFTNGKPVLGGIFLGTELLTGAAALGLLIFRSVNCTRTNGFQPGSLQCPVAKDWQVEPRERQMNIARNAETVMGAAFLGAVIIDIVVAQWLFDGYQIVDAGTATRAELDDPPPRPSKRRKLRSKPEGVEGPEPAALPVEPAPALDDEPEPTPDETAAAHARERWQPNATLKIRPASTYLRGGAGLGIRLDF
ncbi:hypothetical protein ACNOYE_36565 [Nannocystaceae bacterium ST9]